MIKGINKNVLALFKDEFGGKILGLFVSLRAKAQAYLVHGYNIDDYDKKKIINKKSKGTKKCVIKRRLMVKNYTECLFNDKIILRSQERFKSGHHEVYKEEVNTTLH